MAITSPSPRRPPTRTGKSRWNIPIAIQLVSILSISILVSFAYIVRQHVSLTNPDNTPTASDGPPRGGAKTMLQSPKQRVQSQIKSLEDELKLMGDQYMEVNSELLALMGESQPHSNSGKVEIKKPLPFRSQEEDQQGNQHAAAQAPLAPPTPPRFKEREPKVWWLRKQIFDLSNSSSSSSNNNNGSNNENKADGGTEKGGAIIPFDLSVNHLQRIERAPGSPNDSSQQAQEEFLPVVLASDIEFRWRSKVRPESRPEDGIQTTAWRIIARRAHSSSSSAGDAVSAATENVEGTILWDSGKVEVSDGLPDVVKWDSSQHAIAIGSIIDWRVTIWDSSKSDNNSPKPSFSEWSKFAVGPSQSEWQGKWISHPLDLASFEKGDSGAFWTNKQPNQDRACLNWKKRSQLPIFRAQISSADIYKDGKDDDEIATVLLVVSGLGSFRASMDGEPLSSSGPLDPPLTDYAQRVSYRGFDVTPFLTGGDNSKDSHVIGITMGSGWWDHRPIKGSFIRLFLLPSGAITCIAQLYVTYKSGKTEVLLQTGEESSGWQVAKGHIRESSLFTGEYIDLESMSSLNGWDTHQQWATVSPNYENKHSWMEPQLYKTDTTLELWRYQIQLKAAATRVNNTMGTHQPVHRFAPIGKLIPHQTPPVMPMERIYPDEVYSLGQGRWMIDFGKAFSGMVGFENGLPDPIIPPGGKYPRAHNMVTLGDGDKFITVLYGESLEMTTGDINLPLVAGMGLHDGGPTHRSREAGYAEAKGGPCYPKDHDAGSLLQRDVYILPREKDEEDSSNKGSFSEARQSHFTTHAFRFAEICCTAEPPPGLYAMSYRTAFASWGQFSSSNIRINGGYELVKNAMNSNMLSVQSDCPHREKIQYGGDIVADSLAAMHLYDLSAFYRKAIFDWVDQQFDNGAYAGTSYWLNLNDYAGIGQGAGETVWATAPLVMTARHMQHYGDLKLLEETFDHHLEWMNFLYKNFDQGLRTKGYHDELVGYIKEGSGLGDWLSFRGRDTWLTHQGFYMAAARCIAYISAKLGTKPDELNVKKAWAKASEERIARIYLKNGKDYFTPPEQLAGNLSPGPEMSLFSRIVPGEKRCTVLRNFFRREGHTWPGSEEMRFIQTLWPDTLEEMVKTGEVTKRGQGLAMGWSQWQGFNEGILAVKYSLKTLSDNGFHNVALNKANGFSVGTFEYMLAHNATTLWESWWRSEDLYSHNHPMLGAGAEWMVSAVAGVSLHPKTTGGKEVLFWPRFPNSANVIEYADATQGTRRGDFSIAWEFQDLPEDHTLYDSAIVKIHMRLYVPPDGSAVFRVPEYSNGEGVDSTIKYALILPNIDEAKILSSEECQSRREAKMGFNYNWEYSNTTEKWTKFERKKAIGTPCHSFLFHTSLHGVTWSSPELVTGISTNGLEVPLGPGLYDVMVDKWQLKPEVEGLNGRIGNIPEYFESEDVGPYCADSDTFDWDIDDASYLI